jgi:hypothetical protein
MRQNFFRVPPPPTLTKTVHKLKHFFTHTPGFLSRRDFKFCFWSYKMCLMKIIRLSLLYHKNYITNFTPLTGQKNTKKQKKHYLEEFKSTLKLTYTFILTTSD